MSAGFKSALCQNKGSTAQSANSFPGSHTELSFNHLLAPFSQGLRAGTLQATGTYNVLAIMVQFQPETDSLISGTGHFEMTPDSGLDAAPHDKLYFENHLLFLKNYFYKVSGGRLNVNYTVLDSVITLPHQMKYYSPPTTDTSNSRNLGLLFNDSWHAADSIYKNFNFGQYQCFVIFHAGSGRDIDFTSSIGYNPLPYDIPSIYLSLQSLRKMFGSGYDGESVGDGSFHITSSIIMPEWENFPAVSLRLGTNGLLAASFGSFLGLPDLFNTKTGVTGIGRFGLEDGQSIFAYGGIFPPEPCAWEKAYLGWTTPIKVSPSTATAFQLYANETGKYSTLEVPINGTEYFLLENRERDALNNGQQLMTYFSGKYDSVDYSLIQDASYFDGQQVQRINGVVTDVRNFDWALPGDTGSTSAVQYKGGILIWHIDESVVEQNLPTNTINANPDHRGVALMEAIGTSEIGTLIQTILGSYYYDGSAYDFWFKGNPVPSYSNQFTPLSLPNSDSYDGAESHVYITNFSAPDSVMSVSIRTGDSNIQPTAGFPKDIHGATVNSSPVFGHISSDGKLQVVANNGDSLYAFNMDGSSAASDSTGLFSRFGGRFQPVVTSATANDTLYAMDDSVCYGIVDGNGLADTLFATNVPMSSYESGMPLLMLGTRLVSVALDENSIASFSLGGTFLGYHSYHPVAPASAGVESVNADTYAALPQFSSIDTSSVALNFWGYLISVDLDNPTVPVVYNYPFTPGPARKGQSSQPAMPISITYASLAPTSNPELLALTPVSIYRFDANASQTRIFSAFPGDTIVSGPVIADLNGDGNRDIIFATQTKIYAINYAGAALNGFPISTVGSEALASGANRIVGSIAVADLNADGKPEIIFGTQGGEIYAYTAATAQLLPGFPISIGALLAGSPAVTYDSQSGNLYLAVIGMDGYLYSWTFKGFRPGQVVWGNLLGDNYHSNSATSPLTAQPPPATQTLMPTSEVYNWPNPVTSGSTKIRFYLRDNAKVSINIFSFAGDKVADLETNGVGGIANEVDWSTASVQSGVYFARVQAVSANEKDVAIIKIAVVK